MAVLHRMQKLCVENPESMLIWGGKDIGKVIPPDRPNLSGGGGGGQANQTHVEETPIEIMTPSMQEMVAKCILSGKKEASALQRFLTTNDLVYVETDSTNDHCFYEAARIALQHLIHPSLIEVVEIESLDEASSVQTQSKVLKSRTNDYTALNLKYHILMTMMTLFSEKRPPKDLMNEMKLLDGSFLSTIFHFLLWDAWGDVRMGAFLHKMFRVNVTIACFGNQHLKRMNHFGPHTSTKQAHIVFYWNGVNHFTALGIKI